MNNLTKTAYVVKIHEMLMGVVILLLLFLLVLSNLITNKGSTSENRLNEVLLALVSVDNKTNSIGEDALSARNMAANMQAVGSELAQDCTLGDSTPCLGACTIIATTADMQSYCQLGVSRVMQARRKEFELKTPEIILSDDR